MAWTWRSLREHGADFPDTFLACARVARPPVDVVEVARHLGVRVYAADLNGWGSLMEFGGDAPAVFIERSSDRADLRVGIAVQLGHIALGSSMVTTVERAYTTDDRFKPPFAFAANLLMPLWLMTPHLFTIGADIGRWGRLFDVPPAMARTRLWDAYQINAR